MWWLLLVAVVGALVLVAWATWHEATRAGPARVAEGWAVLAQVYPHLYGRQRTPLVQIKVIK